MVLPDQWLSYLGLGSGSAAGELVVVLPDQCLSYLGLGSGSAAGQATAALVQRQAEWSEEMKDFQAAADMYLQVRLSVPNHPLFSLEGFRDSTRSSLQCCLCCFLTWMQRAA